MKSGLTLSGLALVICVSGCTSMPRSADQACDPEPGDVVVRLVDTLSTNSVDRVSPVPDELALQFRCDATRRSEACVLGVDEGADDFKLSRLAMYHEASNTLVIAEGQDEEYVVTRVGFDHDCVSLLTARPLHMASHIDEATLNSVFRSPDAIYQLPNLLEGDGFIATLARDSGVYLEFARSWAATLLDDLSELIRLE